MAEWLGCEVIVRQREWESHAAALAECSSGASLDSHLHQMTHRDCTISNEVFESVDEVEQVEAEGRLEEKQPKIPSGNLVNGTCSPDSGHPSSHNFSSGLSEHSEPSLSTEDSVMVAQQNAPRHFGLGTAAWRTGRAVRPSPPGTRPPARSWLCRTAWRVTSSPTRAWTRSCPSPAASTWPCPRRGLPWRAGGAARWRSTARWTVRTTSQKNPRWKVSSPPWLLWPWPHLPTTRRPPCPPAAPLTLSAARAAGPVHGEPAPHREGHAEV
ncbi:small G protein signaling modulator 1-like isoform X1 [Ailuropoda melanoleuca]|uniref:small G protein signaling modulator 1-like isoform X1 n=1 Tax=Ailuropoda melanoleuca TaxID=9646 RepID=UPI0014948A42|nr:small G protein signaling modulator 1-like isoform X1 [Ailuropoda melanoleuca]